MLVSTQARESHPINGKAYDQALANIDALEKWANG